MATKTKLEQWKGKREAGGNITLPSGTQVRIEVPNVMDMLANGQVPNELVKYATEAADAINTGVVDAADVEKIKEHVGFLHWVVAVTVKEPEGLTPDDVSDLPTEDADMLLEFAMRQRITDALGHHVYGMETNAAWRKFHLGR